MPLPWGQPLTYGECTMATIVYTIRIDPADRDRLVEFATRRGLPHTGLASKFIVEKLDELIRETPVAA